MTRQLSAAPARQAALRVPPSAHRRQSAQERAGAAHGPGTRVSSAASTGVTEEHSSTPPPVAPDDASEPAAPHDQLVMAREEPELLSVSVAATWLGISRELLYRCLRSGQVPVTPIVLGNTRYLARRHLEAWIEGLCDGRLEPAADLRLAERAHTIYEEVDVSFSPRPRI